MLPVRPSLAFFHENILSLHASHQKWLSALLSYCHHISSPWPHLIHHLCLLLK